jgi:hypothetical protein
MNSLKKSIHGEPEGTRSWTITRIVCVAALLFVGISMWHGGLLTALVVADASIPLAVMNGTWTAISGLSAVVFLGGLVAWINGVGVLLMNSIAYCCEGNLARGHTSNSIDD